ncbi:hypothetical protein NP233_g3709 [Leucocoprinus birnbaumii]|uniref:Uncharacterized protein n=1 Tax=Leucocoprinus birnbaumii TaxID=56174 RepID=A0AAD5YW80_9AGAR|nr:hypothetical protein NP233_g3709 [Leucocoprinus birnbaumii]
MSLLTPMNFPWSLHEFSELSSLGLKLRGWFSPKGNIYIGVTDDRLVNSDDKRSEVIITGVVLQSQRFKQAIDLSLSANATKNGLNSLTKGAVYIKEVARGRLVEEVPDFAKLAWIADEGFDRLEKSSAMLGRISERLEEVGIFFCSQCSHSRPSAHFQLSSETGPLACQATRFPGRKFHRMNPSKGLIGLAKEAGDATMHGNMPSIVTFPQPLPEFTDAEESHLLPSWGHKDDNTKRGQTHVRLDEAVQHLNKVAEDVAEIQQRMASFVDAWQGVRKRLATMQNLMRMNDMTGLGLRMGNEVGGDWAEVVEQYKVYQAKLRDIYHLYHVNFKVDRDEVNFGVILRNLEVHAQAMRKSIGQMGAVAKLTHKITGDGRRIFKGLAFSAREKLDGHFDQLIPVLEKFRSSVKRFGGVSDAEPETRQDLVKLLGRTETFLPLAMRDIQRMAQVLDAQVSNARLFRAHFHYLFSSSGAEPGVYSLEDGLRVLGEFGDATLGLSKFCEMLVLA